MVIDPQKLNILFSELEAEGFATSCPPSNFNFITNNNAWQYLKALNLSPFNDEFYFESVELDGPWGNCVAIYRCEEGMRQTALDALNSHADKISKESNESRSWR